MAPPQASIGLDLLNGFYQHLEVIALTHAQRNKTVTNSGGW